MSSLAYQLDFYPEEFAEESTPLVRPRAIKSKPVETPLLRREAEAISPIAVIGFLVACLLVVLVLLSHIELDSVNNQTAAVVTELSSLKDEYEDLTARYEQLFDLEAIKSDMIGTGTMSSITSEQQIYMDLSQPDATSTMTEDGGNNPLMAIMSMIK